MGVPTFRKEDFPSDGLGSKDALDTFFRPLNAAMQQLQSLTNSSLVLGSNAELCQAVINMPASDVVTVSSFSNSWAALGGFQAPAYRIWDTGEIECFGALTGGTSGNKAFTLPGAPGAVRQWGVGSYNGSAPVACLVKINTSGDVIPVVNSNTQVFLDGIRFMPASPAPYVQSCFPVTAKTTLTNRPTIALLASLVDLTAGTSIPGPRGLVWKNAGAGQVQILNLPGLTLGHSYRATLLVASM